MADRSIGGRPFLANDWFTSPLGYLLGNTAAETYIPPVASDFQSQSIPSTGKPQSHGALKSLEFGIGRLTSCQGDMDLETHSTNHVIPFPELEAPVFKYVIESRNIRPLYKSNFLQIFCISFHVNYIFSSKTHCMNYYRKSSFSSVSWL